MPQAPLSRSPWEADGIARAQESPSKEGAELAFLSRSGLMKFNVPAVSSPHLFPRVFFPFGTFMLCFQP